MNVGQKFVSAFQGAPFIPDIKRLIANRILNNGPSSNWAEGSQLALASAMTASVALASAMTASESIGLKLLGEVKYCEFNDLLNQAQAKYIELSNTSTDQNNLFEGLLKL